MRDWTFRRLLALFLVIGLAIVSLRVLLVLFIMGGLLAFAALVVGVVLFTRWRKRRPATAPAARTGTKTGAPFAPVR